MSWEDDPMPELRCRCVFRPWGTWHHGADDYIDRCSEDATAEDGLCAHCRSCDGTNHTPELLASSIPRCCTTPLDEVSHRLVPNPSMPCLDRGRIARLQDGQRR